MCGPYARLATANRSGARRLARSGEVPYAAYHFTAAARCPPIGSARGGRSAHSSLASLTSIAFS
ncbi:hypothetical protein GCM10009863_46410 [Streptomyces axinellae]|uniref:Uncharacterized protein n=1 Tax=Streptomyces axinellae TaxID=552788 RepID=A0ABP6CVT8_9ACTN